MLHLLDMKQGFFVASVLCLLFAPFMTFAADDPSTVRAIAFPTKPSSTFTDDYGDPRAGHSHIGIDIIGPKMTPLYSAVDGIVSDVEIPEARWGYKMSIRDSEGWTYEYIHVNNDTPGTDDGNGGTEHAYAPGIRRGAVVRKGDLVGWMGDSGNAETITSHLHFEIHQPDGTPINPYPSLIAARASSVYSPADVMSLSPVINTDKKLVSVTPSACTSNSLIKTASSSAIYYCGADAKRYVFPNDRVYFSWYTDFKSVVTLTDSELASVPLGGLVTYRPGVKMVKIISLPNVYAVDRGGVLRWVKTPALAATLYGSTWNKKVDDIPDTFFTSYKIGEDII